MFRSDEEAARQRADALQRDLDAAQAEIESLRGELADAKARLENLDDGDGLSLHEQVEQLTEALRCSHELLEASENERRRLATAHRPRKRKRESHANRPQQESPPIAAVWLVGVIAVAYFFAAVYGGC